MLSFDLQKKSPHKKNKFGAKKITLDGGKRSPKVGRIVADACQKWWDDDRKVNRVAASGGG